LKEGRDGVIKREFKVVYRDGVEVSRTLLGETSMISEERIVVRGSYVAPRVALSGSCDGMSYSYSMVVYATWYNAVSAGGSITATGVPLDYGVVAVDPRIIPLGTRMCIPGYGIGVALDTGGAIIGNRIDLGYPGAAGGGPTGYIEIYILG
ncbi:MAG TPA: 3D domain-containing protein, partial [Dehalococcoidia bacterium]|nr:3D domain-containing protein [Dehalococcoidia bacterium]